MLILVFIFSALVSWFACPSIFKLLERLKIYDIPKQRSVHRCKILRMGGLIFITGFMTASIMLPLIKNHGTQDDWFKLIGIMLGAFFIALLGGLDDYFDLRARTKFLYQWIIAGVVCGFGVQITEFKIFGLGPELGLLSIPFTMFWIVGVSNAVNLLDGLDGLAAGTAMIACIFMVFLGSGNLGMAFLLTGLMGGLTAFLRYNSHPAKVFMGDVGSLFLGYNLAVGSIELLPWKESFAGFALPLLVLALPIGDTLWAIGRRLSEGKPPFSPDKNHIHHRLIGIGLTQRQASTCLYTISLCSGLLAAILLPTTGATLSYIILCVSVFALFFALPITKGQRISQIHYLKLYKTARTHKPAYQTQEFAKMRP